jgi:hypothetical protein
MNWDAMATIAEIVGAGGVIASLIYLSIQVRQTSRQTNSQALQVAITNYLNNYDNATGTTENIEVLRKGLNDFESLSANEKGRLHSLLHPLNHGFNSVFTMYKAGLLPEQELIATRNSYIAFLISPGGRRWWESFKHAPPRDLVAYIDDAMRNADGVVVPATEELPWLRAE